MNRFNKNHDIEAEQALVAANRELITRFEKKIQETLACVWGVEQSSTKILTEFFEFNKWEMMLE